MISFPFFWSLKSLIFKSKIIVYVNISSIPFLPLFLRTWLMTGLTQPASIPATMAAPISTQSAFVEAPSATPLQDIELLWYNTPWFRTMLWCITNRAGEPAIFFSGSSSGSSFFVQAAPAPAPHFFLKRLWLWLQGAKNMRLLAAPALAPA